MTKKFTTIKNQVKQILQKEAPEIPSELIDSFDWQEEILDIDNLEVDEKMWQNHAATPKHQKRQDSIQQALTQKIKLPPIITMHHNLWVVDGYTRLAVYLKHNKRRVKAWVGKHPSKKTAFQNNPIRLEKLTVYPEAEVTHLTPTGQR